MRASLASRAADARQLVDGFRKKLGHPNDWEEATWMLDKACELLDNPPLKPHTLVIEDTGWGVEHPDECREDGADPKKDCIVERNLTEWLRYEVVPPLESGRYVVEFNTETNKTRVKGKEGEVDEVR